MAGSLEIPAVGSPNLTQDPKVKKAIETLNGLLNSENLLARGGMEAAAKPVTWYEPKIIATEETRESTSFGTLTTKDEITGVVMPTNGLMLACYQAVWKGSVSTAKRAALFLGANQLKIPKIGSAPVVQESGEQSGTEFAFLGTSPEGMTTSAGSAPGSSLAGATTGLIVDSHGSFPGLLAIRAAAGTYSVSVQFRSTSGSVTAKERALWVCVLGS